MTDEPDRGDKWKAEARRWERRAKQNARAARAATARAEAAETRLAALEHPPPAAPSSPNLLTVRFTEPPITRKASR